jgi:hypothetical protein
VAVPILGKVLRFVFIPPRWEVVQLVGLQTLDQKGRHLPLYFSMTYVVLSCPKLPTFCSL